MQKFLIKLSYYLEGSAKYKKTKYIFNLLLNDTRHSYKNYLDYFMILLIIGSISMLIVGKTVNIPKWLVDFELYFVTIIFSLEYALKLWLKNDMRKDIIELTKNNTKLDYVALLKPKIKYIFSIPALIDLIAIFPDFRVIRLFKLYNYMSGTSSLFEALVKKQFEFRFLAYFLLGIVFSLGSLLYIFEFGINKNINSYLDALYWALVTVSTVGYGDISPVTDIGKLVSMFGIIFGIAMISFVTSVMVSAFSERFDELRNANSINYVSKLHNVIIINGYGHLGMTIANKLKSHIFYEPVIIESDEEKVKKAHKDGYMAICADGSSVKIIEELYSHNNIVAMLTLRSSDIDNIYFILNAKSVKRDSTIYTRINQAKLRLQYEATKVDDMLEPYGVIDSKALSYLKSHTQKKNKSIIFFGYTHKSRHLCKKLKDEGIELSIYENKSLYYENAKDDGFNNVLLLDEHSDVYMTHIKRLKNVLVVCAMNDEALNVYYTITLRSAGFKDEILTLSDSKEDNRKLILAGVSKIFDMYEESANRFIDMIDDGQLNKKETI